MGMAIECDSCGVNMEFLDKTRIERNTLAQGGLQADLCPDCSAPFWASEVGQALVQKSDERRAAIQELHKAREAEMVLAAAKEAVAAAESTAKE